MTTIATLLMLFASTLNPAAFAAEKDGVSYPDKIQVEGKDLVLNGLGTRSATIFNVKVYVAALYLQSKSSDATQVVNSKEIKKVDLTFVRDVEAGKIRDAWSESFKKNCVSECESLVPRLEKLNSYMEDMKKGEKMEFTFFPDRTEVVVKGRKKGVVDGAGFGRVLISSWVGAHPATDDLKKGLLSK